MAGWVNVLDVQNDYPLSYGLDSDLQLDTETNEFFGSGEFLEFYGNVSAPWVAHVPMKVEVLSYSCNLTQPPVSPGDIWTPATIEYFGSDDIEASYVSNTLHQPGPSVVTPIFPFEGWEDTTNGQAFTNAFGNAGNDYVNFYPARWTGDSVTPEQSVRFRIMVFVDDPAPPADDLVKTTAPQHVHEFEKGWGFDGKYIPHFVELNWWFGDSPVINTGIQKLRVHGLSKGKANLTLAVNSMTEPRISYDKDYSEPQWIDLPREPVPPTADFVPVTNYTDTASRGISTQLKFEGRPDPTLEVPPPEPPHVLQVLVIQGSPAGTGATSN